MDAKTSAHILKVALAKGFLPRERLPALLVEAAEVKSHDLIEFLVDKGFIGEKESHGLIDALGEDTESPAGELDLDLEVKLKEFDAHVKHLAENRRGDVLTEQIVQKKLPALGLKIGRYEIQSEISRGAMGAVFRAKPIGVLDVMAKGWGLPETVALKVMLVGKGQQRDEEVKRFLDETKALINLDHKNIIRVFDVGQEGGLWFYAMELIEGEDVRCLFQDGKPPPVQMALSMVRDLAEALLAVHQAGLLHRDIKPSNVLLDKTSQPYRPVLIDFGLITEAAREDGKHVVLGTPNYMPPEQANPKAGVRVGRYSDVYALGATLYFMLTGKPPFQGWTAKGILQQVLDEAPKPPSALREGIPPEVEALCLKCLEKLPKDRFRSMDLLLTAIDGYLEKSRRQLRWQNFYRKIRRILFGKKA